MLISGQLDSLLYAIARAAKIWNDLAGSWCPHPGRVLHPARPRLGHDHRVARRVASRAAGVPSRAVGPCGALLSVSSRRRLRVPVDITRCSGLWTRSTRRGHHIPGNLVALSRPRPQNHPRTPVRSQALINACSSTATSSVPKRTKILRSAPPKSLSPSAGQARLHGRAPALLVAGRLGTIVSEFAFPERADVLPFKSGDVIFSEARRAAQHVRVLDGRSRIRKAFGALTVGAGASSLLALSTMSRGVLAVVLRTPGRRRGRRGSRARSATPFSPSDHGNSCDRLLRNTSS